MATEDQPKQTSATSERVEVRVKDRRRINLDDLNDDQSASEQTEASSDGEENNNLAADNYEPPALIKQLETRAHAAEGKLIEVQKRFDQLRTEMQRDLEATRLRLNKAAEEKIRTGKAEFIGALIPVLDNLHRAIEAAAQVKSKEGSDKSDKEQPNLPDGLLEGFMDGLRGTASGFEMALAATGVEPVASVGVQFNPELHEAVDTMSVALELDGIVTVEYSRGYKLGDRLLRPARVQVGRTETAISKEV
ncbi:MAG: nucleotide exchange factor GrpE [Pyrinomonadaceae bacterium]